MDYKRYAYLDTATSVYEIGTYIKPSYEGYVVLQKQSNNMMVIVARDALTPVFEPTRIVRQGPLACHEKDCGETCDGLNLSDYICQFSWSTRRGERA